MVAFVVGMEEGGRVGHKKHGSIASIVPIVKGWILKTKLFVMNFLPLARCGGDKMFSLEFFPTSTYYEGLLLLVPQPYLYQY